MLEPGWEPDEYVLYDTVCIPVWQSGIVFHNNYYSYNNYCNNKFFPGNSNSRREALYMQVI